MQNLRNTLNVHNVLAVYRDLWLPKRQNNLILEGINPNDGTIRALQVKSTNYVCTDEERAIIAAYENTFCIPLVRMFELTRDLPFYQPRLHGRLQRVFYFAPCSDLIKYAGTAASVSTTAKPAKSTYKITNIAHEFDKVNHNVFL